MIRIKLSKLSKILGGEIVGNDVEFNTVTIDSNKVTQGCLFIAINGKRFDAHNFIQQAKEKGASALLVNHKVNNISLPQVIVKDTRTALGVLAGWVRKQVPTRILALTGSSGKTSVKEMTTSILKNCGNTLCTAGNLNNDIGVSMTLLKLDQEYDYAIIELGASHHGEIAWTASLTNPEVVLINNLTASHLKGFGSIEGVAKAKSEIYTGLAIDGIAIINTDSNDWKNWQNLISSHRIWYFSLNDTNSDFTATNIHIGVHNTKFTIKTPIGTIDIVLPLPGKHNIANALAATALSIACGAPLSAIKSGLENFSAISGRLFPIALGNNKLLIDDSYNSNVDSMIAAIHVLHNMPGYRVMVVGDMDELDNKSEIYHLKIGSIVQEFNLDCVLSIGRFSQIISKVSRVGEHFSNKKELIKHLKILIKNYQVISILVKGSRSALMEEVVYSLKGNRLC